MKKYLYWYFWFIKESFDFMQGYNKVWILFSSIKKGFKYAHDMCVWDNMTPQQRDSWYLSGEGRTLEF